MERGGVGGGWDRGALAGGVARWRVWCANCLASAHFHPPPPPPAPGVPLVYELDADLKPVRHYYLGDADEVAKKAAAVAAQGSAK